METEHNPHSGEFTEPSLNDEDLRRTKNDEFSRRLELVKLEEPEPFDPERPEPSDEPQD